MELPDMAALQTMRDRDYAEKISAPGTRERPFGGDTHSPDPNALCAIKSQRAVGVAVNPGVMARVAVLTWARALLRNPFAVGVAQVRAFCHRLIITVTAVAGRCHYLPSMCAVINEDIL